jgi:hypothetical protein
VATESILGALGPASRVARSGLVVGCLVVGCALDRAPIRVGAGVDAGPVPDATAELDAPSEVDAPEDASVSCMPTGGTETACDRVDDDCDGTIDDDGVCSGCTALTVLGRAYLSCPGPVSGMDAWSGACRTAASGYDLAIFSSTAEREGVVAGLAALALDDPHFIGLNDFRENGRYVWRDGSTTFAPTAVGANDLAKRFVAMLGDGSYEERSGADTSGFLCEEDLPAGAGCDAPETTCDAIDGDCDGRVDEGVDCGSRECTSATFWDRVYWVCTDTRNHGEARGDCMVNQGAFPATLNDETEHAFVAAICPMPAWLGLGQATDSPTADQGWTWLDTTSDYGVPVTLGVRPWDAGEPNDAGMAEDNRENCGLLLEPGRNGSLDDRACNDRLAYVCERSWAWGAP